MLKVTQQLKILRGITWPRLPSSDKEKQSSCVVAGKEERDKCQTKMNLSGIGCLSQRQCYRVIVIQAAVGVL